MDLLKTASTCLLVLGSLLTTVADAHAEACPSARVGSYNGSRFSSCTPIVANTCESVLSSTDARIRDIEINSVALGGKPLRSRIILPKNYEAQPSKRWPVLYLLTGHGASYRSWSCNTGLRKYVENLDVILVMPEGAVGTTLNAAMNVGNPEGGIPSWYSNWQSPNVKITNSSGTGPYVQMNIRTHHTEELRDILNNNFRADNTKYAIAGLSMGGFGAAAYAITQTPARPFIALATFSAPLDTEFASLGIPYVGGIDMPTVIRGSIEAAQAANGEVVLTGNKLWGEKTSATWKANNPKRQVTAAVTPLATIPYYLSAGQGNSRKDIDIVGRFFAGQLDVAEAGAWFSSTSFLGSLVRTGAPVTTEFFPKYGHTWTNWDVNICHALNLTLVKALDAAQQVNTVPIAKCPPL